MAAAYRRAQLPTSFEVAEVGRHPPEVESAVYFSTLALKNAGKHAGDGAAALVQVWEGEGGLGFEVTDNGSGFDFHGAEDRSGLTNLRSPRRSWRDAENRVQCREWHHRSRLRAAQRSGAASGTGIAS